MSRVVTLAGFVLLALAIVWVQVTARRSQRLPTFGQAMATILDNRVGGLLAMAAWLWLGWHIFVRFTP